MDTKNIFHFKKFSIRQQHAAMKVGTDGVLLGAWANPTQASRILDIGTGTGLIALMLAQRTTEQTKIEAIEIDQSTYEEACRNVEQSPWKNRIQIFHQGLQNFLSESFDLIVCNPPFFENSLKPPNEKRMLARHSDQLPMNDLALYGKRLLKETGKISLIIPQANEKQIHSLFNAHQLYCSHKTFVRTKLNKPIERCLLTFSLTSQTEIVDELILLNNDHSWTNAYVQLTKDFYLKP